MGTCSRHAQRACASIGVNIPGTMASGLLTTCRTVFRPIRCRASRSCCRCSACSIRSWVSPCDQLLRTVLAVHWIVRDVEDSFVCKVLQRSRTVSSHALCAPLSCTSAANGTIRLIAASILPSLDSASLARRWTHLSDERRRVAVTQRNVRHALSREDARVVGPGRQRARPQQRRQRCAACRRQIAESIADGQPHLLLARGSLPQPPPAMQRMQCVTEGPPGCSSAGNSRLMPAVHSTQHALA